MPIIYRCDACNKLVENDKDICKMRFYVFHMREGVSDPSASLVGSIITCTECKNKILKIGKNELEEDISDGGEGNTQ